MKTISRLIMLLSFVCIFISNIAAQETAQSDMRENPEIDAGIIRLTETAIVEIPDFINIAANHISMNGANWDEMATKFRNSGLEKISIVHIGDSHLQADMATAVVRKRLTSHYGSNGRSLIIPFRLAGTNEPPDYTINISAPFSSTRLLGSRDKTTSGFTGISISPADTIFDINITSVDSFDAIFFFYTGERLYVEGFDNEILPGVTKINFSDTIKAVSLTMICNPKTDIHGFCLSCGDSGVAYNVIGNNGATFSSYNALTDFPSGLSLFQPTLIILSLGTNEAFGNINGEAFKAEIALLINNLSEKCPGASFMLTTPSECQRRRYTGRGRRRRRAGFMVNSRVKSLRDCIIAYGKENKIPVYDFYEIAGGDNSSSKWLSEGLMNKDRIHLLRPGYQLQGSLFADALIEALENLDKEN